MTNTEKRAILVCRTGNKSLNNYAAETIWHAKITEFLAVFLQGPEDSIILEDGKVLSRFVAGGWYQSAIKADSGIGEEKFNKDMIPISTTANSLKGIFGDV